MPYEDLNQPAPDLVAAGGAAPTADSGQMIDALRSRGSLPGEALMALLQQGQPTAGQQMANAFTGGFAAMAGVPNPVQQQLNFQQQQGLASAKLFTDVLHQGTLEDIARGRLAHEIQRDKFTAERETRLANHQIWLEQHNGALSLEKIYSGLLDETADPAARLQISQNRAKNLQILTGAPTPQGTITGWMTGRLNPKIEKLILGEAEDAKAETDPLKQQSMFQSIQDRHGISMDTIQGLLGLGDNARQALGLPSQDDLEDRRYKRFKREQDYESANMANVARKLNYDPKEQIWPYVARAYSKFSGGASIYDIDMSNPAHTEALSKASIQGPKDAVAFLDSKTDKRHQDAIEMLGMRFQNAVNLLALRDGKTAPGIWVDTQTGRIVMPSQEETQADRQAVRQGQRPTLQKIDPVQARQLNLLAEAQPMIERMRTLTNDLMVDHGPQNLANGLRGQINRSLRNDPRWSEFDQLVSERNILLTNALQQGGQFRTQLLQYLQKSGNSARDTWANAQSLNNLFETTIQNKRNMIINGSDLSQLWSYPPSIMPGDRQQNPQGRSFIGPMSPSMAPAARGRSPLTPSLPPPVPMPMPESSPPEGPPSIADVLR